MLNTSRDVRCGDPDFISPRDPSPRLRLGRSTLKLSALLLVPSEPVPRDVQWPGQMRRIFHPSSNSGAVVLPSSKRYDEYTETHKRNLRVQVTKFVAKSPGMGAVASQ